MTYEEYKRQILDWTIRLKEGLCLLVVYQAAVHALTDLYDRSPFKE
jgi:hypothetical protein